MSKNNILRLDGFLEKHDNPVITLDVRPFPEPFILYLRENVKGKFTFVEMPLFQLSEEVVDHRRPTGKGGLENAAEMY